MRKCSSCKHQVTDNYEACPYCGSFNLVQEEVKYDSSYVQRGSLMEQMEESRRQNMQYNNYYNNRQQEYDSGSIGWTVLGFFIPIVGFILYFVWKNNKPCCAKMSLIGGVIGFILNCILISQGFE